MGDSVDHDIRILVERNWRNLALHREECRKLLNEARAMQGCRASDDEIRGSSLGWATEFLV
jgi:hypothetical protein